MTQIRGPKFGWIKVTGYNIESEKPRVESLELKLTRQNRLPGIQALLDIGDKDQYITVQNGTIFPGGGGESRRYVPGLRVDAKAILGNYPGVGIIPKVLESTLKAIQLDNTDDVTYDESLRAEKETIQAATGQMLERLSFENRL